MPNNKRRDLLKGLLVLPFIGKVALSKEIDKTPVKELGNLKPSEKVNAKEFPSFVYVQFLEEVKQGDFLRFSSHKDMTVVKCRRGNYPHGIANIDTPANSYSWMQMVYSVPKAFDPDVDNINEESKSVFNHKSTAFSPKRNS